MSVLVPAKTSSCRPVLGTASVCEKCSSSCAYELSILRKWLALLSPRSCAACPLSKWTCASSKLHPIKAFQAGLLFLCSREATFSGNPI